MKSKILIIVLGILISSCSTIFISDVNKLKPVNEYSTDGVEIKTSKVTNAEVCFVNDKKVKTKIQIFKDRKGNLDPNSMTSFIAIYDKNGKRNFLRHKIIKSIVLTDNKNQQRVFVNRDGYPNSLQELNYDGKIKWFVEYTTNVYDYSTGRIDHLVDERGTDYKIGSFKNFKKTLKELTAKKPNLSEEIDKLEFDKNKIINILREYEN